MIVVSDATPLIGLAKIGQLVLLQDMFGEVLVPQAVYNEVVWGAPHNPDAVEIRHSDWIHVRQVSDQMRVDYLRVDLDAGEAEALVLASELEADWLLVDEIKARLASELLGMRFIGTLGLLLLAKRQGRIEKIRPLLDALRSHKFYLSDRLCQIILREAGEV